MSTATYLETDSKGHPQRRKMYAIHDRHNLRSNIDFLWVDSL